MANSLDGIKKLNPDEIKKYRKIVLNYIGEKDPAVAPEQKDFGPAAPSLRRVDGVNLNKVNRPMSKGNSGVNKLPLTVAEPAGEEPEKSRQREAERLKGAIRRQEEERKKIKEEERQYQIKKGQAERDRREQEEGLRQEKIRLEEERVRQEKTKRQEEIARIKLARQAAKQRAKENRKAKRGEAIRKIRQNINNKLSNFFSEIKQKREKTRKEKEIKKQERIKQLEKDRLAREQIVKEREEKEEKARQERIRQAEIKKQERESAEKKHREQAEAIRQEQLKKQEIARQVRREAEAKRREDKIKLAELKKEENRRARENIRLEKIKRREEIKRIRQEVKIKRQAAREKKRIKRKKAWKKVKRNLNFKLNTFFFEIKKNIIYIISLLILSLAIFYIIFCIVVLRFNNNFIGWAASYLPVPAVITSQEIISYNNFRKIGDRNYLDLNLVEKKKHLAKWVVLRDLREKYRLPAEATNDALAIKYVLDEDFNQIGLSRINKINGLLKGRGGFEPLAKYADEYSGGVYYDNKGAVEKFGPTVLTLVVGQTSNIIPRADGYYIVNRGEDKNNQLGLKYIFVKAQTLDQYVFEEVGKIKVFILAN